MAAADAATATHGGPAGAWHVYVSAAGCGRPGAPLLACDHMHGHTQMQRSRSIPMDASAACCLQRCLTYVQPPPGGLPGGLPLRQPGPGLFVQVHSAARMARMCTAARFALQPFIPLAPAYLSMEGCGAAKGGRQVASSAGEEPCALQGHS